MEKNSHLSPLTSNLFIIFAASNRGAFSARIERQAEIIPFYLIRVMPA